MEILLVRHAIAGERDAAKWPDDRLRPLTREGIKKFRSAARGLSRLIEMPDAVLSSSLARAWQTAEILEGTCGWPEAERLAALEPGHKAAEALAALKKWGSDERVVLVGHEPDLGGLLATMLAGAPEVLAVEFKKGGAALVRFDEVPRAGGGKLLWLVPPRILRASAEDN